MSIGSVKSPTRFTYKNHVRLLRSGPEYFQTLLSLIRSARKEIHLQTYILASDPTGTSVLEALLEAAKRKVRVYILIDAYGSQKLSSGLIRKLVQSGIRIRKYGRFYSRGRFHIGRRLHHKITVIDGYYSIVGGINISDNYNDTSLAPAWLDFAVLMEGEVSRKLQLICHKRWSGIQKRPMDKPCLPDHAMPDEKTRISVRRNDFIRNLHEAAISYRQAIRKAQTDLLIVGGYFLPGGRTRRLIRNAIKRGVNITVLTAEKSDVTILRNARRYLYRWMIRNGIRIFSYDASNVHGKVMIMDDKWTTIGSYDLNNLSTYSNIELNVDIDDRDFSAKTKKQILDVIEKESTEITQRSLVTHDDLYSRIINWISYRIVKSLFVLSFILAGKRKHDF